MSDEVMAFEMWSNNALLIAAVAWLGYITETDSVADVTYGKGNWWTYFRPEKMCASDLHNSGIVNGWQVMPYDFTDLPYEDNLFDVVAFDPPYKLNGSDQGEGARYGVDKRATTSERMDLIFAGLDECVRIVKPGGYVLVKCQDQVVSGAVYWQRFRIWDAMTASGCVLVDMFDKLGARAQPTGRSQLHARRNSSTLMVFAKASK